MSDEFAAIADDRGHEIRRTSLRPAASTSPSAGRELGPRPGAEAFHVEVLDVVEINAEARLAAALSFDPDDIDAAFEELDARYLAGEAAAHSHTWTLVITRIRSTQQTPTPSRHGGLGEYRSPPTRINRSR